MSSGDATRSTFLLLSQYFDRVERERLLLYMLGHVDDVIRMLVPIDKYAEFINLNATFLKAIYAYL